eukprot:1186266-Prorocentrum_minimum.AAC.5
MSEPLAKHTGSSTEGGQKRPPRRGSTRTYMTPGLSPGIIALNQRNIMRNRAKSRRFGAVLQRIPSWGGLIGVLIGGPHVRVALEREDHDGEDGLEDG